MQPTYSRTSSVGPREATQVWGTDTSELLGNSTRSGVARGPAPLSASYAHVTTCCAYVAGKHWPIALLLSLFNHCCSVDSEMFELYEFTQPSSEGPRCFSWNTGFLHSAVPSDSGSVSRGLLPPSAPQITQDTEFSFFTVFRKRPTNLLCWRFGGSGSGLSILDLSKRALLISHVFSVASVLPCSPVPRVRVQCLPLQFPNANSPSFINQNKHFKKQFLLISPLQFICHSQVIIKPPLLNKFPDKNSGEPSQLNKIRVFWIIQRSFEMTSWLFLALWDVSWPANEVLLP